MTDERLHDLDTVLTYEEIEELRNICYEHGNSWCPISDFFNDIERTKDTNYNKNQAFKDLWLIVNIVLEKEKKLKTLEIIKNYLSEQVANIELGKPQKCLLMLIMENDENYDLLKEVLL